jgi:hypothetical protein
MVALNIDVMALTAAKAPVQPAKRHVKTTLIGWLSRRMPQGAALLFAAFNGRHRRRNKWHLDG